jgi:hypothetical protein
MPAILIGSAAWAGCTRDDPASVSALVCKNLRRLKLSIASAFLSEKGGAIQPPRSLQQEG